MPCKSDKYVETIYRAKLVCFVLVVRTIIAAHDMHIHSIAYPVTNDKHCYQTLMRYDTVKTEHCLNIPYWLACIIVDKFLSR